MASGSIFQGFSLAPDPPPSVLSNLPSPPPPLSHPPPPSTTPYSPSSSRFRRIQRCHETSMPLSPSIPLNLRWSVLETNSRRNKVDFLFFPSLLMRGCLSLSFPRPSGIDYVSACETVPFHCTLDIEKSPPAPPRSHLVLKGLLPPPHRRCPRSES